MFFFDCILLDQVALASSRLQTWHAEDAGTSSQYFFPRASILEGDAFSASRQSSTWCRDIGSCSGCGGWFEEFDHVYCVDCWPKRFLRAELLSCVNKLPDMHLIDVFRLPDLQWGLVCACLRWLLIWSLPVWFVFHKQMLWLLTLWFSDHRRRRHFSNPRLCFFYPCTAFSRITSRSSTPYSSFPDSTSTNPAPLSVFLFSVPVHAPG